MNPLVAEFYNALAGEYHLMFEDWEASMARQAAALGPILERECGAGATVLDCACGIGTQSLGLARRGFRMVGSDVSAQSVERAKAEAAARGLAIPFYVADMLRLCDMPDGQFDAVICMDNALPHLALEDLGLAAGEMLGKLRSGGVLMASVRDYDRLLEERPVMQGPAFYLDDGRRRIVFQLWDWMDDRRYRFHLYVTRETDAGWVTHHGVSEYRALTRGELTAALTEAGFADVRWLEPAESGFYQPIVIAGTARHGSRPGGRSRSHDGR